MTTPAGKLPYLTSDLAGIGGRIKLAPEDFRVEEIPLYKPCGQGTHVYFRVEKIGIPTPVAVERIARHMKVRPADIGFAGLKDARAVTVQTMSLEHCDADRLAALKDANVHVDVLGTHANKLRPGHLAGNRFDILICGVGGARLGDAKKVLDVLARRGAPNFFDKQRFGVRGDTWLLGGALVMQDADEFISLFLGRPSPDDPPDCRAARDAFDMGYLDRALGRWPRHYSNERRALAAFKRKKQPGRAIAAIDKRMRRFYVSAFQSHMFNEIVSRRMDSLDRVLEGDFAVKSDTGGIFPVEDPAVEQPRADAFEISPTGAIFGYRTNFAGGVAGRIEREVLAAHGVELASFRGIGALRSKGTRRSLRFRPTDVDLSAGSDERGEYIRLRFAAPPGCYATIALREIMKND